MLTADFTNEKVLVSNISFARQDLDNGGSDIRSMIVVKSVCLMLKNEFSLPKIRSLAAMLKIVHELLETPPLTHRSSALENCCCFFVIVDGYLPNTVRDHMIIQLYQLYYVYPT